MQKELGIVDCEKVKELHEAIKKGKSLKEELGIP
jgi:anti-sigma28 factor (negative regulator of flagellin synthesis)